MKVTLLLKNEADIIYKDASGQYFIFNNHFFTPIIIIIINSDLVSFLFYVRYSGPSFPTP